MAKPHIKLPVLTEQDKIRFYTNIKKLRQCHIWKGKPRSVGGYGQIKIQGTTYMVHRIAYSIYYNADPGDLQVMHSCDNHMCVTKEHLSLGTPQENSTDMVRKGRQARGTRSGAFLHPETKSRGESHPKAIIPESTIIEMREYYQTTKTTYKDLAARFGVSRSHTRRIVLEIGRALPSPEKKQK